MSQLGNGTSLVKGREGTIHFGANWARCNTGFFTLTRRIRIVISQFLIELKQIWKLFQVAEWIRFCTVHLLQKRPNWRITYLLYYLFDYKYVYIYRLAIICSIAHKILVAMVTTFENTSLATAKPAILWQNFQLQSCVKSNSKQLCNWRFFSRSYSFQDKKYHRIDFYWNLILLYLENYCS